MRTSVERRWRFAYDDRSARDERCWSWMLRDGTELRVASLRRFDSLDACIADARASGFGFEQPYDIVFARQAERLNEAAL